MWMNVNRTYATSGSKNCWASLPNQGWRKVKPSSDSGVTNVHLMLCLARANGKQANVTVDSNNQITTVYL
jgi:astacin